MLSLMARSTAIWLVILTVAIMNGAFRQGILVPRLGDATGHVISTVLLSGAVLVVTWLTVGWIQPSNYREAWSIGAYWLALTVGFEFLAGHYLFHTPWPVLLADYNVLKGRIWPLVLVLTFSAPAITTWFRTP